MGLTYYWYVQFKKLKFLFKARDKNNLKVHFYVKNTLTKHLREQCNDNIFFFEKLANILVKNS